MDENLEEQVLLLQAVLAGLSSRSSMAFLH